MNQRAALKSIGVVLSALCALTAWGASPMSDAAVRATAHDIFKQLIEINTTDSVGSTTVAAQAMAQRLLDAGFRSRRRDVLGTQRPQGQHGRALSGQGRARNCRPILIIGHLDVVEARREDWTTDPFQFVEQGRLFLWTRHAGHEGQRRHRGHEFHSPETGRLRAGPRHHPRAHRRRGGRKIERRELAAEESPRSDRRRVRAQSGQRRSGHRARQAGHGGVRGHRKALRRLSGARDQPRRPQLAAQAGQCDLPRRACA